MKKLTMLTIMDGFGLQPDSEGNAIAKANTPNLDKLFKECPNTKLNASGRFVGLPEGQMGSSEVGHTNMGAGRVVWQELSRISNEIDDGSFFKNEELLNAMKIAKSGHPLHILGLVSDGGIHSHEEHLFALLDMAKKEGLSEVYVHFISDGRDTAPLCAEEFIKKLEDHMKDLGLGKIASIGGRHYALDRDKRYDRVEKYYNALTLGEGFTAASAMEALENGRARSENDEQLSPSIITGENGKPLGLVNDEDPVIFFDFRPDRPRELTRAFVDPNFNGFERKKVLKNLFFVTFTEYEADMPNVHVAFKPVDLTNTLGEYVSKLGLKQLRIAETEKYAHVTFFFSGGRETPFEGEDRILIASPKVNTYDEKPEMSAFEVTDAVLEKIKSGEYDLIVLNLANCDMVGHCGKMPSTIKAVETVDTCVGKISKAVEEVGGTMIITADHGNADIMIDPVTKEPVTAHTTSLVPCILFNDKKGRKLTEEVGSLRDIAPTILELMELPIPKEFDGKSLLR